MSELEDLIRDVCSRGELTHLSLTPRTITDADGKPLKKGWGATFAPSSVMGNTFAEDTDPVEALKQCIEDARLRRKAPFNDGDGAPTPKPRPAPKAQKPTVDLSDMGL